MRFLMINICICTASMVLVGSTIGSDARTLPQAPGVTIAVSDSSVVESAPQTKGTGKGVFIVSRHGSALTPLTVKYKVSGTASSGSDYNALAGEVTIPSRSPSATIIVTPIDDDVFEGDETVVVTLIAPALRPQLSAPSTLVPTNYVVASPGSATVTVVDDETQISLKATDQEAAEANQDTGAFTLTRSGPTDAPLLVSYAILGEAANGTDYDTITDSVKIPARSSTATIAIKPKDDAVSEQNEKIYLKLKSSSAYSIGPSAVDWVNIIDNDTIVNTSAGASKVAEKGGASANFIIKRSGNLLLPLTVQFSLSGDAVNGADYEKIGNSVGFSANVSEVPIKVTPKADTSKEANETVTLTIVENKSYTLGAQKSASMIIDDNGFAFDSTITLTPAEATATIVTVNADVATTTEGSSDPAFFLVNRTGSLAYAVTVHYQIGGTGTNAIDYESLPNTVTIPVGQASVRVPVKALADKQAEGSENVTIAVLAFLSASSEKSYAVGKQASATITILDSTKAAKP